MRRNLDIVAVAVLVLWFGVAGGFLSLSREGFRALNGGRGGFSRFEVIQRNVEQAVQSEVDCAIKEALEDLRSEFRIELPKIR